MKRLTIIIIISCSLLTGCFIGAGTHGKIKVYQFDYSNNEIVSIVDQFLLANPDYYEHVFEDNGWVYIKIPPENDKFGFRIGGDSEIVLIAAGRENETTKWEKDLGYFEEKRLIENFEKNFLAKLEDYTPRQVEIIKNPFILTINKNIDTVLWPHYVFKYDTLISYPLTTEFDSLGIDYFEDLVLSFASHQRQEIKINQYQNLFRINTDYSGHIGDSIFITAYYRIIGQPRKFSSIFEQESWRDYTKRHKKIRLNNYKTLRESKIKKGYMETEVYSKHSEELWMIEKKDLKKIKNGS